MFIKIKVHATNTGIFTCLVLRWHTVSAEPFGDFRGEEFMACKSLFSTGGHNTTQKRVEVIPRNRKGAADVSKLLLLSL